MNQWLSRNLEERNELVALEEPGGMARTSDSKELQSDSATKKGTSYWGELSLHKTYFA